MSRLSTAVLVLVILSGGLIVGNWAPAALAAQTPTTADGHPLIGSWLIYEANPPAGGEPVLAGVATFFDDGNALVSFGDQRFQGLWMADSQSEATFTVVAPSAGGVGEIDQLRGSVEVATDGGPFRGIYTFDVIQGHGTTVFTYRGPIEGRRVAIQEPEPYP
jgi:hypothetical protein